MSKVLAESRLLRGSSKLIVDHIASNGSDHSFINQDVTTNASPTFVMVTITGTVANNTDVATKEYVDSEVSGLDPKESVRAATMVAGTLGSDFANNDIIDGVTLVTGNRILIKDQANGVENGIYIVAETGTPSRSSDFAIGSNVANAYTFVEEGSQADQGFICSNNQGSDVVGTNILIFNIFSSSVSAGNALSFSDTTLNVLTDNTTVQVSGTNQLQANVSTLAGAGLTPDGQGMAANVDSVTIEIVNDGMQANVSTLAGAGLIADGQGMAANVDGTTIEIVNDGMQANISTLAGAGLIQNGQGMSINVDGTTIQIVDDGLQANISTIAGAGLIQVGAEMAVNVDSVTIEIVNDGLQANVSTLAGAGLIQDGQGMAANVDGTTIEIVNDGLQANISTLAGAGLIQDGQGMAANVDGTTIEIVNDGIQANVSTLAGTGLIADGQGMAANVDGTTIEIVNDGLQANVSTLAGTGLIADGQGMAANVDGTTIEIVNDGLQANISTLAGAGLVANGQGMSINVDGTTIQIVDDGLQANISTLAGAGLIQVGQEMAVNVDGTTIEIVNDGLQANVSTLAGNGLIGDNQGMAVNVDGVNIQIVNDGITLVGTLDSSVFASNAIAAINEIGQGEDVYHINSVTQLTSAISSINSSGNASTIKLAPGTYTLTSAITLPRKTKVEGSGMMNTKILTSSARDLIEANSETVISSLSIDGSNTTSNLVVVPSVSDFRISDCKLENISGFSGSGVMLELPKSNTIVVDSCIFSEISITNFGGGISGEVGLTAKDLIVKNSTFRNVSAGLGFYVFDLNAVETIELSDSLFEDSVIGAFGLGVTKSAKVLNNRIFGGAINSSVYADSGHTDRTITVCDNEFRDPSSAATVFTVTTQNNPSDIKLCNNTIIGNHTGFGMRIDGSSTAGRDDNMVISDNIIKETTSGLYLSNPTAVVTSNYLANNSTAITLPNTGKVMMSGNKIQANTTQTALFIQTPIDFTINDHQQIENITATGTLKPYTTQAFVDTTAGAFGLFVPDLSEINAGFKTYIELDTDGGDLTLTPNTFVDGTSITFANAGEYATLEWTGSAWTTTDSNFNYLRVNDCGEFCVNNETDLATAFTEITNAGGGTVRIAPERMAMTSGLNIPDNISIIGAGQPTKIDVHTAVAMTIPSNTSNVSISGLNFVLNGTGTFSALSMGTANNIVIGDCIFRSNSTTNPLFAHNQLNIQGAADTLTNFSLTNCTIEGGSRPLLVSSVQLDRARITNNTFHNANTAVTFADLNENSYLVMSENIFANNILALSIDPDATTPVNNAAYMITNNILANNVRNWHISDAGDRSLIIKDNYADVILNNPAEVSGTFVDPYESRVKLNKSGAAGAIGFAIGNCAPLCSGHTMTIEMDQNTASTPGDSIRVTPAQFVNGDSINIAANSEYITLEWIGNEWELKENQTTLFPVIVDTSTGVENVDVVTVNRQRVQNLKGSERLYTGLFTLRPNTTAAKTTFTTILPGFTAFDSNTDITVQASGYVSNATIDEGLNNVYSRGNSDGTNGNVLVSFTSTSDSPNLDHILQINARYNTQN